MKTRKADFAGTWYPGDSEACRDAIDTLLKGAQPCPQVEGSVLGGIVPHAGWFYSGQVASQVIRCLARDMDPETCIVFGRHLHPGGKNYIMKEGGWATPLGDVEIDQEMAEKLLNAFPFIIETASNYEPDNTIELQLPFVKYFFPKAKLLPIGVPPAETSIGIGERIALISRDMGRKIAILGSTDLTHYGYNYGFIPKGVGKAAVDWVKRENDRRLVQGILSMDAHGVIQESLRNHNACCSGAVAAAIAAAKGLGARRGEELIYTTSYDIRPDDSFVGYVGVVFS
jgi:AmmeMemoRadiSam system protein B